MWGISKTIRVIALAALMVRALLPVGWTPDAQAGLVICNETPATIGPRAPYLQAVRHAPGPSEHRNEDHGKVHHQACSFAHTVHMAAPVQVAVLAPPAVHALATATGRTDTTVITVRFLAVSARAPPSVNA